MRQWPLFQVDAFTDTPLQGNPCAVVLDADDMDGPLMQQVAREMNLSETAFVLHSAVADVGARYFTPAEEIPLAGHPTLSTLYTVVTQKRVASHEGLNTYRLELPAGVISVDVLVSNGAVQRVVMSQRKPQFLKIWPGDVIAPLFRLSVDDLLPGAVLQTVSTGTPQLMIPLRDLAALRKAEVQVSPYLAARSQADWFSAHLFCLQGATPAGRTYARHFGTPPDAFEDPFTGSASGGMGAYLWRYGLIDTPAWKAEQGHWMGRPGTGTVEVVGPRDDIETVRVGGQVAPVLEATLRLP
ncbi:MAG TPA: PhzF family phenazine biosynthesis protein [Candidatus Xenobia bacterium]|jgi:trans-2,3-dihydro-3-hydroxyanthranilate isomerase